jgi:hypothetical protein
MKGGNMKKNFDWLVWLVALIAIISLVLSVVALSNASVTGKGIFSFVKKTLKQTKIPISSQGILADAYLSVGGDKNFLKGYEVKYDENGELIYEIVDEGTRIVVGSSYSRINNGETDVIVNGNGNPVYREVCLCEGDVGALCGGQNCEPYWDTCRLKAGATSCGGSQCTGGGSCKKHTLKY